MTKRRLTRIGFYHPESDTVEAPCIFFQGYEDKASALACLIFGDYTGSHWLYSQWQTVRILRREFGEPACCGPITDSNRRSYLLLWNNPTVPENWRPYVDYCRDEQALRDKARERGRMGAEGKRR